MVREKLNIQAFRNVDWLKFAVVKFERLDAFSISQRCCWYVVDIIIYLIRVNNLSFGFSQRAVNWCVVDEKFPSRHFLSTISLYITFYNPNTMIFSFNVISVDFHLLCLWVNFFSDSFEMFLSSKKHMIWDRVSVLESEMSLSSKKHMIWDWLSVFGSKMLS